MNRKQPKISISYRIPSDVYNEVSSFHDRNKCRDFSDAVSQLLRFALYMEKRLDEAKGWTPEDINEVKKQLEEGQLVDWVQTIDPKKLELVADIFNVERDARNKQSRITKY